MSEIIGIGSSVYDTLMTVSEYPPEDTKKESSSVTVQGGGPCATALVAASILGTDTAYAGILGDDAAGNYMMEDFRRFHVETSFIHQKHGNSFQSVVLLSRSTNSRTCVWNRGTVEEMKPEEVPEEAIKNSKILALDGHQLKAAITAAGIARKSGTKVLLDAGGIYPGIEELLPMVNYLIPSEEFALKITGCNSAEEAAVSLWEKYRPEFICITQGEKGGSFYSENIAMHYHSFKVNAVDTNGAGDVFHGAFAAALVKGMQPEKAAIFSSAVSALKCTKIGARKAVPDWNTVIDFLNRHGENF